MFWFEITKMLIAVKKNLLCYLITIVFGTLSFPIIPCPVRCVFTSLPLRERGVVMRERICLRALFLCVCPRAYLQNYKSDLRQIFMAVTYFRFYG